MEVALSKLKPLFVRNGPHGSVEHVEDVLDATGVMFFCPKCTKFEGGEPYGHMVLCWFKGKVPDDLTPGPGRWAFTGGLHNLSLVPSINLSGPGCGWHGFVTGGVCS